MKEITNKEIVKEATEPTQPTQVSADKQDPNEPTVFITHCGSKINQFKPGDRLPLSKADTIFQELDVLYREEWEKQEQRDNIYQHGQDLTGTEVRFKVGFIHNGKKVSYSDYQQLGSGRGSLVDSIQAHLEQQMQIIPSLRKYCSREQQTPGKVENMPEKEPAPEIIENIVEKESHLIALGRELMSEIKETMVDGYDRGTIGDKDAAVCKKKLAALMNYIEEKMEIQVEGGPLGTLLDKVVELSQSLSQFNAKQTPMEEKVTDIDMEEKVTDIDMKIRGVSQALDGVEKLRENRNHYIIKGYHNNMKRKDDNREAIIMLEALRIMQDKVMYFFQKAADMDIQAYGKVSDFTVNCVNSWSSITDIFRFRLDQEGKVEALKEAYLPYTPKMNVGVSEWGQGIYLYDEDEICYGSDARTVDADKQSIPEGERAGQGQERQNHPLQEESKPLPAREYLHLPVKDKQGFEELKTYLKEKKARFDPEQKLWHIKPDSVPFAELKSKCIYPMTEILDLPHQGREHYRKTNEFLKANGARFHPTLKKWYLTPESNKGAIIEHLQKGRKSVLSRLEQNKQRMQEGSTNVQHKEREAALILG